MRRESVYRLVPHAQPPSCRGPCLPYPFTKLPQISEFHVIRRGRRRSLCSFLRPARMCWRSRACEAASVQVVSWQVEDHRSKVDQLWRR